MAGITKIDSREFVVCWMRADSKTDVMKSMNLTIIQVNSKANYLRRAGVNLPKLPFQCTTKLEVAQLNSLIKKMQSEKVK